MSEEENDILARGPLGPVPSPEALVRRLVQISLLLDKAQRDAELLDEEAVRAKSKHRVGYARAFLDATGAMDMRTQTAVALTADLWFEYELADQKLRACKERIRTLRDQLEIARSLSAALRSEWGASGSIGT